MAAHRKLGRGPSRLLPCAVAAPDAVHCLEGQTAGGGERAIRTLKEQLQWLRTFETGEDLGRARVELAELYDEQGRIERHGFRLRAQRRCDHYAQSRQWAAWLSSLLTNPCPESR